MWLQNAHAPTIPSRPVKATKAWTDRSQEASAANDTHLTLEQQLYKELALITQLLLGRDQGSGLGLGLITTRTSLQLKLPPHGSQPKVAF